MQKRIRRRRTASAGPRRGTTRSGRVARSRAEESLRNEDLLQHAKLTGPPGASPPELETARPREEPAVSTAEHASGGEGDEAPSQEQLRGAEALPIEPAAAVESREEGRPVV